MRAIRLAYTYIAVSIVVGPAILIAGSALFPTTVACGDEDFLYEMTLQQHINQLHKAQLLETICAGMMLVVGFYLVRLLRQIPRQKRNNKYPSAIILTAVMMVGYGLIIVLAALMTWCATG